MLQDAESEADLVPGVGVVQVLLGTLIARGVPVNAAVVCGVQLLSQ